MKRFLLFFIVFTSFCIANAQYTETFETVTNNATSFNSNGTVIELSVPNNRSILFYNGYTTGQNGYGWNGTNNDSCFISNYRSFPYETADISIKTPSKLINVNSFFIYLGDQNENTAPFLTETITITGKLNGNTVFSVSQLGSTFNSNSAFQNGFTFINLATFGGQNNTNAIINELQITNPGSPTTGAVQFVAIDALTYTVQTPSITTAQYNAITGVLSVTGANFVATAGINNDINTNKFTITGQNGATYPLTSGNVEMTNTTSFSVTLNPTDKIAVDNLLNRNGTTAISGTTYNLAAAADWLNATPGFADATNAITANNIVKLSALSLGNFNLNTTFDPNILTYAATVGAGIGEFTITPTASFGNSNTIFISVNGGADVNVTSGAVSTNFNFVQGVNTILVKVKSADLSNTVTYTITTNSIMGDAGAALNFEGVNDNAAITHNNSLNTNQYTIESYVKWDGTSSVFAPFICSKGFEVNEIHITKSNNSLRFIPVPGLYVDTSANTFLPNTWTHIACVYNPAASLVKIYINGVDMAVTVSGTSPLNTALTNNNTNFVLGSRHDNSLPFKGALDEFRFWNRALTQAEIVDKLNCEIPATASGLISNLHFNQGFVGLSNTTIATISDSSSFNNNATLANFNLTGTSSNFIGTGGVVSNTICTSFLAAALDFDGSNDFASIASNSSFNVNQFTIETWLKWDSSSSVVVPFICSKGLENMEVHINKTTKNIRFIPTVGVYVDTNPNSMPENSWVHLAFVYNPNTSLAKIYVNGIDMNTTNAGSNPISSAVINNAAPLLLGSRGLTIFPLKGTFDEFRVWNRALTQAEILSRMNCEVPTTSCGLIANLHFNQGTENFNNTSITNLIDSSGNSNNALLNNFTLNGSTSNFIATGGVVSGTNCSYVFPAAPTANNTQSFCGGGTVANLTATGFNLLWYATATGGTPLATSATLTNNATYYVSQTVNSCESARSAVAVTINTIPTAPTANSTQSFCGGGTVANLTATGSNLLWYATATGGAALATSTNLTSNTTYYVSQTVNGCESTRTAVAVIINPIPSPPFLLGLQTVCQGTKLEDLTILSALPGATLKFYDDLNQLLAPSTILQQGEYYISQVSPQGCESGQLFFEVIIKPKPSAPIASATQIVCQNATIANLTAVGSNLKWFDSISLTNLLPITTPLTSQNYFVTQTTNGCESLPQTVAVTVNPATAVTTANATFCSNEPVKYISASTILPQTTTSNFTGNFGVGTWYHSHYDLVDLEFNGRPNPYTIVDSGTPTMYFERVFTKETQVSFNIYSDFMWQNFPILGFVTVQAEINGVVTILQNQYNGISSPITSHTLTVPKNGLLRIRTLFGGHIGGYAGYTTSFSDFVFVEKEGNYNWAASNGGQIVGLSNVSQINVATSGTYVATFTNDSGCVSTASSDVTVIESPSSPTASATQSFCSSGTIANLTATGTDIKWYATATGGMALATSTALVNGTTYYVAQTVNGCESARTAVRVSNSIPNAPTAAATQTVCLNATIINLTATGSNIKWYDVATGGTALPTSTTLVNGTTYYASQRVNGCESTSRTAVSFTTYAPEIVNLAPAIFCSNQPTKTITSTITAPPIVSTGFMGDVAIENWTRTLNGFTEVTDSALYGQYSMNSNFTAGNIATMAITLPYDATLSFNWLVAAPNLEFNKVHSRIFVSVNGVPTTVAVIENVPFEVGSYTVTIPANQPFSINVQSFPDSNIFPNAMFNYILHNIVLTANPVVSSLGTYQWVASNGGTIIGNANNSTVNIGTAGNYQLNYTSANGCTSSQSIVATVVDATPLIANTTQKFCTPSTIANLTPQGNGLKWFDVATGGNPLVSTTPLLPNTNTYYVANTGCETERTAVTAIVDNSTIEIETASSTFCAGSANTLTAKNYNVTSIVNQFTGFLSESNWAINNPVGSIFNFQQFASNNLNVQTLTGLIGTSSCSITFNKKARLRFRFSSAGTADVATASVNGQIVAQSSLLGVPDFSVVDVLPGQVLSFNFPFSQTPLSIYRIENLTTTYFDESPLTGTYAWQATNGGTIIGANNEATVTVATSGTYEVTYTSQADCVKTKSISVVVNPTPAVPTASATQSFCGSATIADLTATGTNLLWYATATGGTALATTTALATNTTYYVSQTTDGCESTTRTAVAVTITPTPNEVIFYALDQVNTADYSILIPGTVYQTFKPASTGSLSRIAVYHSNPLGFASQTPTTATMRVYQGLGVSGTLLATATVNVPNDATAFYNYDFSNLNVYSGFVYTFEMVPNNSLGENWLSASEGDNYADGRNSYDFEYDLFFKTFFDSTSINLCLGATVADLTASNTNLNVYANANGGSPLAATSTIATNTTYYISQSQNGCESNRKAILVQVQSPAAPTANPIQYFCDIGRVEDFSAVGDNLKWYTTASGGAPLAESYNLINGTTYYVSQTVNGCESVNRTAVLATITAFPAAPIAAAKQGFCGSATIADLTVSGTFLRWYDIPNGGFDLPTTTALTNNTTYYVSEYSNVCEGPRTAIKVQINDNSAPEIPTSQNFCSNATIADFTTNYYNLNWYSSATGGTALASNTALVNGLTYYASKCGGTRTPITAIINTNGTKYVNGAVTASGNGASWATAFKTIQEGINASCNGEIWVAAGTYRPTQYPQGCIGCSSERDYTIHLKNNTKLYGGFNGTETSLSQRNIGTNQTIITGNLNNQNNEKVHHVVLSIHDNNNTELSGFVLKDGYSNLQTTITVENETIGRSIGGGIFNFGSQTHINNCVFDSNYAEVGGGIFNTNSSITASNLVLIANSGIYGGGIFNGAESVATYYNITMLDNNATALGSAIFNQNTSAQIYFKNIIVSRSYTNAIFNDNANVEVVFSNINGGYTGEGNLPVDTDPLFTNIAIPKGLDNKWFTDDDGLQLQNTSPCVNAGSNTHIPQLDVLGNPIFGGTKDMGAYERQLSIMCNGEVTTWNGTSWSNGVPTSEKRVRFKGNYNATSNLTACSLEVIGATLVTVPSGVNFTISNEVKVAPAASLTFENNAQLIQTTDVVNEGNITIKRNSNVLKRLDYTMWSSPVTGSQSLLNFSPLTSSTRFYTYNPSTDLYNAATPAANFSTGTGYLIRMPNEKPGSPGATTPYFLGTETLVYTGAFTGVPNNGVIYLSGLDSEKYHAVGNPYPSTIDMNTFITDNSIYIESSLYFWRKTNSSLGGAYCTWNAGTFVSNGQAQVTDPNDIIQVGQGFIVKTKLGATGVLFRNGQRVANTTGQFFRTKKEVSNNRIWLNATNDKGEFAQMAINYRSGASKDVDEFDAKYFNDATTTLNSVVNAVEYAIQGRALPFDATDEVPLSFKATKAGMYSIAIDHVDGLFAAGQDIFLKDNVTGIETDLKAGAYSFTAAVGADASRFSLKYQKTLKVDALVFNENSVRIYKDNGVLYVKSSGKDIKNIEVYDVQGRLIAHKKNVNATTASINNLKDVHQVMIVKVSADDNSVVSKKVLN